LRYAPIVFAVWVAGCSSSLQNLDAGGASNGTSSSSGGAGSSSSGGGSTGGPTSGGSSSGGSSGGGGLDTGVPCAANAQCKSGVCGTAGNGKCCTASCDTTDPVCGATACDGTGACVFPSPATGCQLTCSAGFLATQACDGTGHCVLDGGSAPCSGFFVCSDSMTCGSSCTDKAGCVAGYYCASSACAPQKATGPCLINDACTSALCGVSGTGNCCALACDKSDPQCGATNCDALGTCFFPGATTPCGTTTCTGSTLSSASCLGTGKCGAPNGAPCPGNLVCADGTQCKTACTVSSDCISGDVCDTFNKQATCCAAPGTTIYVDNTTGVDGACCGSTAKTACQTLTRAMALVTASQKTGITLQATVNGGGGDWKVETFPVTLEWGVTLSAPGVYFDDQAGLSTPLFDVASGQKADTSGYAVIEGTGPGLNNVIIVGTDSKGNQVTDAAGIFVENGMTLYLLNAYVSGNSAAPADGIQVLAGGTLSIGEDLGKNTGPVTIGGVFPGGLKALHGQNGIVCKGTLEQPANVTDHKFGILGFTGLQVSYQAITDIDAEDFCTIDLESSPILGTQGGPAFNWCGPKVDAIGVLANGAATVTFGAAQGPGTIQCMQQSGIDLENPGTKNGSAAVLLKKVTFQNDEVGLLANDGSASVQDSTFRYNYRGVVQSNAATVDLSGNGGADPNTVICSESKESYNAATDPGIDVWNQGTKALAADFVTWDSAGPDYFACDAKFTSCSCNTSCINTAGKEDMDAVEDSTNLGTISITHPSISLVGCN
jgi:hypothetical protein